MSAPLTAEGIRRFPFFAGLSDADAASAAGSFTRVFVPGGQPLFQQGDEADSVYLVAAGEVEILLGEGEGSRRLRVAAPSIVGEMGVLLSRARAATVVARADTELWRMCRFELDAALDRGERWAAQFAIATARFLAGRLSDLQEEIQPVLAAMEQPDAPTRGPVLDDLERLRERLFTEWTF